MIVHVDDVLKIGGQHKVCEDYILSSPDPIPHIILADGCSSSRNTDTGARILCYMARQFITTRVKELATVSSETFGLWVIHNAESIARHLGLNRTALDATLLVAYIIDNKIYSHVFGDGYIIKFYARENDRFLIEEISYIKNAPFYLSYHVDPERFEQYINLNNKMKIVKHSEHIANYEQQIFENPCRPFHREIEIDDDLETFMIASDGLGSFITKAGERLGVSSVIFGFNDFKSLRGEFLKRRLVSKRGAITMLEKDEEFSHADDISVGAFCFEDDE